MWKNKFISLLILLLLFVKLYAQKLDSLSNSINQKPELILKKNSLRFELLGKLSLYGLYYERKFINEDYDTRLNVGIGNFLPTETTFSISFYYCYTKFKYKPIIGLGYTLFYRKFPMPTTKFERDRLLSGNPIDVYPYLREPLKPGFFMPLGLEFHLKKRSSFQILFNSYLIKEDYKNNYLFGFLPSLNYGFNF
jgi:hypothetical protein